ncbi:palmdelphin-like [Denticeps clupeoides]|uniref:palmdelphin-like n=1 Tax=Denticeps clupeoides TaxID=299321 RepID=UPI0010A3039A|nr:palmdelphin-like [Denticeps clupeoides]
MGTALWYSLVRFGEISASICSLFAAMFAMEISVEKDMRTGESLILSAATISPTEIQQKGIKVFDDGRKSVYALSSGGQVVKDDVGELSPRDVEELLLRASEKKVPVDVEYHEPVFSTPFNRPSTPRKADQDLASRSKTPSPSQLDSQTTPSPAQTKQSPFNIPEPITKTEPSSKNLFPHQSPKNTRLNLLNGGNSVAHQDTARLSPDCTLVSSFKGENHDLIDSEDGMLPFYQDTKFSVMNTLPMDLETSEPITMIFMGYQTAEDEEDEEIQAELVVIGDDQDKEVIDCVDPPLSYHPEGYHSKIFCPSNANVYRSEVKASCIRNYIQPRSDIVYMGLKTSAPQL